MPANVCPRCHRANPELAAFCYFDGAELRGAHDGSAYRMPREFVFPSGRRCRTYDEFAQGCQEEWAAARDLLQRGTFAQFFGACGRADLVRAAEDARVQENPDIALTTFLGALPGVRTQTPKLDINPRRFLLGNLLAGDTRALQLQVLNQGQGTLQGTLAVSEGQSMLGVGGGKGTHELAVNTPRQQAVALHLDTSGLPAGQSHGAKLTVVTNGGVVEVPLRFDLGPRPFPKAPFQGARTQRELAERMRAKPKDAVPLLESGEVRRWFALNGWTYPVTGPDVRGVAVVQQFFEALGLSKPPTVTLSPAEVRVRCRYPDSVRQQVTLATKAKKWVYAHATSDTPWIRVTTPVVSGPQQATVGFEVDSARLAAGTSEGQVKIVANGGQALTVRVAAEAQGAPATRPTTPTPPTRSPAQTMTPGAVATKPRPPGKAGGALATLLALPLLFLLVRLVLVPVVDLGLRGAAVEAAAAKLDLSPAPGSPATETAGWLRLPWLTILAGSEGTIPAAHFRPGSNEMVSAADFRDRFASYLIRGVVLWTWWLGGVLGAVIVGRRGGLGDAAWGLFAGAFAGLAVSATVASAFLVVETVPHALWQMVMHDTGGSAMHLAAWAVLAVLCWGAAGLALGAVLSLLPPLRRVTIDPVRHGLSRVLGVIGLRGPADFFAPA